MAWKLNVDWQRLKEESPSSHFKRYLLNTCYDKWFIALVLWISNSNRLKMYYLTYIIRFLQNLQNSSPVSIMVDLYYFHISACLCT